MKSWIRPCYSPNPTLSTPPSGKAPLPPYLVYPYCWKAEVGVTYSKKRHLKGEVDPCLLPTIDRKLSQVHARVDSLLWFLVSVSSLWNVSPWSQTYDGVDQETCPLRLSVPFGEARQSNNSVTLRHGGSNDGVGGNDREKNPLFLWKTTEFVFNFLHRFSNNSRKNCFPPFTPAPSYKPY